MACILFKACIYKWSTHTYQFRSERFGWECIGHRLSRSGRRWLGTLVQWFSVVCIRFSLVFSSWWSIIVHNQSLTSRRSWSATRHRPVGDNWYKLEGSAKTCRRMVSDWSPMGGNLHAMVGDSHMISAAFLLTACSPLVIRLVLH